MLLSLFLLKLYKKLKAGDAKHGFVFGGFGRGGIIIKDGPNLDFPSKKERKKMEKSVRKVSKTAGNIIEGCNNVLDSKENLEETLNPMSRLINTCKSMTIFEALCTLKKGDHIKVMRSVYSHHGIYIGHGDVIEYNDGIAQETTLQDFADGDKIILVDELRSYKKKEIVQRAKSRLGESDYNILYNNCENFATWCRCGGKV